MKIKGEERSFLEEEGKNTHCFTLKIAFLFNGINVDQTFQVANFSPTDFSNIGMGEKMAKPYGHFS